MWVATVSGTLTIQSSTRPFGGAWGPVSNISSGAVYATITTLPTLTATNLPQISINRGGGAAAVWVVGSSGSQTIQGAAYIDGQWKTAVNVTQTPSPIDMNPQIVTHNFPRESLAEAIWEYQTSSNNSIQGATFNIVYWTTPENISTASSDTFPEHWLAVDLSDNTVATWIRFNGTTYNIESNQKSVSSDWGSVSPVLTGVPYATNRLSGLQVAISNGLAVAIWANEAASGFTGTIDSSFKPLTGAWGALKTVYSGMSGSQVRNPQVAIDSAGYAVALWIDQALNPDLLASTFNSTTSMWSPYTGLQPFNITVDFPQLALDGTGNAIAVWYVNLQIVSKSLPFGGSWDASATVLGTSTGNEFPRLSVNTNGLATVVWDNSSAIFSNSSSFPALCAHCPVPQEPSMGVTMWFVDNSNPVAGDGSYNNPYKNLQTALSASHACDVIYVFPGSGPYDSLGGPFVLLDNQRLLSTTREAFQLCPDTLACSLPELTNTVYQTVVYLQNNNEVSGFQISPDSEQSVPTGILGEVSITNALITKNIMKCSVGTGIDTGQPSACIAFSSCPNLGTVTISDCLFLEEETPMTPGNNIDEAILFSDSKNANILINNNIIQGIDNTRAFPVGIDLEGDVGNSKITIQNNTISCQSNSQNAELGIALETTGTLSAKVISNNITLVAPSTIAPFGFYAGVYVKQQGSLCLKLYQNTVLLDPAFSGTSFAGYTLLNEASTSKYFVLDFDSSNKGTLSINDETLANMATLNRIYLTAECP